MPWGRVCFVGEGNTTTFDISPQIIHKQLTIYGSWTFSLDGLAEVARFVVERRVPMNDLITHRFALQEAVEAYKLFDSGKTGKVVFVWGYRRVNRPSERSSSEQTLTRRMLALNA
jgi:threonine dehydrogenase-like Zn-dependent dehydrogenase